MKEKNNIFLMIIAVVALIATVGGATYAYFASSITEGEGLNLDVTAEASTAQFTATGGDFGFTVTGAEMQQGNAGQEALGYNTTMLISLKSDKPVSCTFDLKFKWDEKAEYIPTNDRGNQFEFGLTHLNFYHFYGASTGTGGVVNLLQGNGPGYDGQYEPQNALNFDTLLKTSSDGGYDGYVLKNASLSLPLENGQENEMHPGEATMLVEIRVAMFNLSHDQSSLAGGSSKTYSGKFYVTNVVC